jgi:hypothetical protein
MRKAFWLAIGVCLVAAGRCPAAETVTVTFPAATSFTVTDVTVTTTGNTDPQTFSYSASALTAGHALLVSVQANAANFSAPGGAGATIPCGNVSWTISSAQRGTGSPGTLSTAYTLVYTSQVNPTNGNVKLHWFLAPPPSGIYAGAHTLVVTWKLESM